MMRTGPKPEPEDKRFWRHVEKTDSCWNWTGCRAGGRSERSYGYFRIGSQADGTRRQVYAHRWAWEYFNGDIPEGLQVNHHCDNSLCVNPAHLYLGTQDENVRDKQRRGPSPNHCRGKQGFIIVVDSREKKPYRFPLSQTRSLKTGDYSIAGCEHLVTIERKKREELFTITGRERARFKRELKRMAEFDYAAIVIEADLPLILQGAAFSKVSPRAVVKSLVSWSIEYGVHIFFAGDRNHANALTRSLLEKYWKYYSCKTDEKEPERAVR